VEEWIRIVPDFSYKKAFLAKEGLIKRYADPDKVQHVALCWFRLKVLYSAFYQNTIFRNYIVKAYRLLNFLENQEEYSDFLDHWLGESTEAGSKSIGNQPISSLSGYTKSSIWRPFFGPNALSVDNALSLSLFVLYEIEKPSKTEQLCWQPYDNSRETEFSEKFEKFLDKYLPKKLYVPDDLACHHPGTKKFNDGGSVRHDYEEPINDWNSGFQLQSFLTGPLTVREVWLPGRVTKMNNAFWFIIIAQIIRNVPYYANNYPEPEQLWNSVKSKLKGSAVHFDVTGFGLQFPRSLLEIAARAISRRYYTNVQFDARVTELVTILNEVWLQYPDGSFKKPLRGIGLGYYETLKTICVLALIDESDPISVFGDQGLIPLNMKKRKTTHPMYTLPPFGFIFDEAKASGLSSVRKIKQLPNIETGVLWGGLWLTPNSYTVKKSWTPAFAGALACQYHWERKAALHSLRLDKDKAHLWKYISFHYEIAFGYEFYASESLAHPENLGINPEAIQVLGNTRHKHVFHVPSPKTRFTSNMGRTVFPTSDITRKDAKTYSIERRKAYNRNRIINTIIDEIIHPKIVMNNTRAPQLSVAASKTPFWQAARELLLYNNDVGTISYELSDSDLRSAIMKYSLADNPYEVKATGGYRITSLYKGIWGTSTEHAELTDIILNARKDKAGSYIYNRNLEILPPSAAWDEWNKEANFAKRPKLVTKNPYLLEKFHSELVGLTTVQLSERDNDFISLLQAQLSNKDEGAVMTDGSAIDTWEDVHGELSAARPEAEYHEDLNDFYELLDPPEEELAYRPESPKGATESYTWIL
jgi:hypothetical protein